MLHFDFNSLFNCGAQLNIIKAQENMLTRTITPNDGSGLSHCFTAVSLQSSIIQIQPIPFKR
jgi:hypothetical protein